MYEARQAIRLFGRKDLVVLLAAAYLLLLPALYNGFPIVTPDSGAYVQNAFELMVPVDRAMGYSVFLRLTSLGFTLWGPVAAQCIITAFFLLILSKHFLGTRHRSVLFLATVLVLATATSGAWFCSQLMPDAFTAILLLAVLTWYIIPLPHPWQKLLLACFIFCVLMQHNSHSLTLLLVGGGVAVATLRRRRDFMGRSLVLVGLSVGALLVFSALNKISGKRFEPSAASGVFLMCRLVESGVMDKFLAENCKDNKYNLCAYRNELPRRQWVFMWAENSPLAKTGGWEANEMNYRRIEKEILTTPRYLSLFLFKSAQATLRQLAQIHVGDGNGPFAEGASPYRYIGQYYPYELKEYRSSRQNENDFPLSFFNGIIISVSLLLVLGCLLVSSYQPAASMEWWQAFRLILYYLFCNAAITATFSTVLGRFGARVFWVLPFICILYLWSALPARKSSSKPE